MIIHRKINQQLQKRLLQDQIQLISGQRCVGKNIVINNLLDHLKNEKQIPENRIFSYNFDDILVQLEFNATFESLKSRFEKRVNEPLETLSEPIYLIFEQIQNSAELFEIIAALKQVNPSKIKMVLTSSVNLENNESFKKLLAEQTDLHWLHPIALNELIRYNFAPLNDESVLHTIFSNNIELEYFEQLQWIVEPYKDTIREFIKDYLLFGSLPATYTTDDPATRWEILRSYLRVYFERDLRIGFQIADLNKFNSVAQIFSMNNGNILNLLNLCEYYNLNRNTIRKYSGIMDETFLIDFVYPYLKNKVAKPIMRTPKIYFQNTGLVNYFNGTTRRETLENSAQYKSNMDAMLYVNLKSTLEEYAHSLQIQFLRDYQEHQLDFLIPTPKALIPIGITHTASDQKVKIKTFRYYLRYCQQISDGVIFGDFDKIELLEMRGSRLFLLPLWMLW
jgi:predicted AAA+ superfamily ATPase